MSPRLRWEISHAAPIVRNTNDTPANRNPTTYQMPVTRRSLPVGSGSTGHPSRGLGKSVHPEREARLKRLVLRTLIQARRPADRLSRLALADCVAGFGPRSHTFKCARLRSSPAPCHRAPGATNAVAVV